jgi:type II secretory pathway predicted ATPase ExeA/phage tail protein X
MYNKFYGFSQKPFELLPDPRFLFLTTSHREIIASIMDGIRNRRGFISITGETGTGKTTLIRFLLGKLEVEEKVKTVLIFHPTITFKELLENILLELDLEVMKASKGALLRQLNEYLTQMIPKNEVLVVIIDEAQGLSREVMGELGMLPKLATFQVLFVGQPKFEDKLNSQGLGQLRQRIGIKHQISLLNKRESEDYIDHRLRLVRSSSAEKFTQKAISLICSHAQGIPRIINNLCDNAFLLGYGLSQERIDVDVIREVIKDIEGPTSEKTILSSITTALRKFGPFPIRLEFSPKRASQAILSLLCLGGLIFMTQGYLQRRPTKTWNVESSKSVHVDTQPSSTSPFPQETKESKLKGESPRASGISSEFPQPVTLPFASAPSISELDELKEVATIKEGETLSYLAQKYYRRTNTTLIALILDCNPEITNADLIQVNQKIKVPKITEELLITQSADNTYKIHVGTFENAGFVRFYSSEATLKGKEIRIFPRKVSPQGSWYQVMVGTFDHKDECLKVIDKLKEKELLPAFGGILKTE